MTNYNKLLQCALMLISRKRYTVVEMRRKLTQYVKKQEDFKELDIDPVLERLAELNYLNDEQFAKDYISERMRLRPRGCFLLKKELGSKGISKDIIESALNNSDFNELEIAIDVLSGKISKWGEFRYDKQKAKAYQFLSSRGFSVDTIYKTIESCYSERKLKDL
jgi:regulatory protein